MAFRTNLPTRLFSASILRKGLRRREGLLPGLTSIPTGPGLNTDDPRGDRGERRHHGQAVVLPGVGRVGVWPLLGYRDTQAGPVGPGPPRDTRAHRREQRLDPRG